MKCVALLLVAAFALTGADVPAGGAPTQKSARPAVAAMEKSFDQRLQRLYPDQPFFVLGPTRGLYLERYGIVFTAEVDLVSAMLSPFHPVWSKEELAKLRKQKLERIPVLRQSMREMLVSSAASMDVVPSNELVVLSVLLKHRNWEDASGMPTQIMMQAPRRALLELQTKGPAAPAVESVIRTQEY